ncbi:hypothetical protein [Butyricicoccus pullicaecorum]|uniref:hypothetical protein n=1 Tax=Butyricicoccus pullicaecorum TaxID=501571 RepID=UPI0039908A58
MLSSAIGICGALISLIGWFVFHSFPMLIVGTFLFFIETAMEWNQLNSGAKALNFIIIIIGCIVGLFVNMPIYISAMLAINIYSALMVLLTIIIMLIGNRG